MGILRLQANEVLDGINQIVLTLFRSLQGRMNLKFRQWQGNQLLL